MNVHLNLFTTANWYQHFIPLFAYCWTKAWPQYRVDIAVMGKLDDMNITALSHLGNVQIRTNLESDKYVRQDGVLITEHILEDIPLKDSTANTARFLFFKDTPGENCNDVDGLFITDIDFLFFDCGEDIIQWHIRKMEEFGSCYYAHHGPWKKPQRFPGAWKGEYERLAGGAAYLSREWFSKCKESICKYGEQLRKGEIGTYREEDEVLFCRICKENGLPINQDKIYPARYRGLHLGDFRPDMQHRWTDMEKMRGKLLDENCMRYLQMCENDPIWNAIYVRICKGDEKIKEIFHNLYEHLSRRGLR